MTKKFLSVILITLFSAVAMFANDISTEVQTEQKIQQQATPDFSSNSAEFSLAEKDFAAKYSVNPRNTADVWYKYKKFIKTGIGMAVSGGIMYTVGTPAFLGIALGMLLVNPIVSIVFYICSGLIGFAGILVQSLCSVPFAKSAILAGKYKNIYNVKLKHAASEAMILSMHNSENKEFRMAMAFAIK
ncbi:MAG: hypothetical protein J6B11_02105 [Spirochaetales bacterium]|nr:hypothetical protein [Spirochaetales bacterium]